MTLRSLARLRAGIEDMIDAAGSFRAEGVRVWHVGVVIDQSDAALGVDDAASFLRSRYEPIAVDALLRRVTVRVVEPGAGHAVRAGWTGGFFDRGRIVIDTSPGLSMRLTRALVDLVVSELDPDRLRSVDSRGREVVH